MAAAQDSNLVERPCICISFALPQEYAPFQRRARLWTDRVQAGYSGAGAQNSSRHAAELLCTADGDVAALLICGFGGSLGEAGVADVVIASDVLDCTGSAGVNTKYQADSRLLATAESVRLPGVACHTGALATTDRVLLNRDEKQAFLDRRGLSKYSAACVDMETAGAARIAAERGIPWLAVRTVTDAYEDTMPFDFNALADGNGNVAIGRVIAAALSHPGKIPALMRLGQQSSRAATNLTDFLFALLPIISLNA